MFSKYLQSAIDNLNIPQKDAAALLRISNSELSKMLNQGKQPKYDQLIDIMRTFNLQVESFFPLDLMSSNNINCPQCGYEYNKPISAQYPFRFQLLFYDKQHKCVALLLYIDSIMNEPPVTSRLSKKFLINFFVFCIKGGVSYSNKGGPLVSLAPGSFAYVNSGDANVISYKDNTRLFVFGTGENVPRLVDLMATNPKKILEKFPKQK